MDASNILTLAQKELRDSLRNRWFLLYTAAFISLTLALSALALSGSDIAGFAGFGRTAASLVNLVSQTESFQAVRLLCRVTIRAVLSTIKISWLNLCPSLARPGTNRRI